MNYSIKPKHLIIFLIIIGVISFLFLINFNKHEYSTDKMANKELKEFHRLLKDGEPAYSLAQANSIAIDLIPLIEKTAGKKFKWKPEIRLMSTEDLEIFLIHEINNIKFLNNSDTPMDNIKQIRRYAKTLLGIYDKVGKIIYLLPQRIPVAIRLLKVDGKHSLNISTMIIAHELTHALQDQYMNLIDCFNKIPGNDELYAFRSTIEGHATFIEKKVAKQLGIDDLLISLAPLADSGKIVFTSPKLNEMMRSSGGNSSLYTFDTAYTDGEDFINYNFEKGGNKFIWIILKSPPVDTAMIIYPETYRRKNYDFFNYKKILENVYDFQKGYEDYKFIYENNSANKLGFRLFLNNFSLLEKKTFFSEINHIQFLSVYSGGNNVAEIVFILLKDQQHSDKIISSIEKRVHNILKANHFQDIQPWENMRKVEEFRNLFKVARHTSGIKISKNKGHKTGKIKQSHALVATDNMIVTYVETGGFDLFPYDIEKIATTIFNRYKNAKKMHTNESKSE